MATVKERIRKRLDRQGKTQADLAIQVGVSEAHISQILSGRRRPSLPLAVKLEDATGVPAADFVQVA